MPLMMCDNCGTEAPLTKSKFCKDMLCEGCYGFETRLERSMIAMNTALGRLLWPFVGFCVVVLSIMGIVIGLLYLIGVDMS